MSTSFAPSATAVDPLQTLQSVQLRVNVVQDFRPLSESLEWQLSELHWRNYGLASFVSNDVPYTVNNSGALSLSAARTLFTNCEEVRPDGPIRVLEAGAGSGLFARAFVDEFRRLCDAASRPYFDQLVYYVSDASPRTVAQWLESGQFADFGSHVVPGVCNALEPGRFELAPAGGTIRPEGLRAVFANYLLDSLPASIIRKGDGGCQELMVRTVVRGDAREVRERSGFSMEEIRALVASADPADQLRLIRIAHVFDFDSEFRVPATLPPYAEEALGFGYDLDRVLLNHGAIRCLEANLALLAPDGFVCFSDYGALKRDEVAGQAVTQRFGPSVAIGVNFPLLDHFFSLRNCDVSAPPDDESLPVHPRLLTRGGLPRTKAAFADAFHGNVYASIELSLKKAREFCQSGRSDLARKEYEVVLGRLPRDWRILGEVAEFVIRETTDYGAAERLARAALQNNPWHSTWLLNVLGDALFCLERFDDAHAAYLRAREMDGTDVRTNLNLAYTFLQQGNYRSALDSIAAGLACDRGGQFRERLLQKQQEVLQACADRWAAEQDWMARRVNQLRG